MLAWAIELTSSAGFAEEIISGITLNLKIALAFYILLFLFKVSGLKWPVTTELET
jgi:hypothetical protein